MARRVLDVFLSSTAQDLAPYRQAVHDRLSRTGLFHCVRQEEFGAQDAGAVDFCCRSLQAADLFIGLVGLRRGWEPEGDNARRSLTEMEHDWARELTKRRYLWVTPEEFPVPGHLRESDELDGRQKAFRKRVMGAGERIVSQKGFATPELLASEIVEHLLAQIITSDLIRDLRPDVAAGGPGGTTADEQAPAIAAAVGKLADERDIDLLELARNPQGVDVADLEAKLRDRAEAHEQAGRPQVQAGLRELKLGAEYWRHLGALAFLHDTRKALAAYDKAVALDPGHPDGVRAKGELHFRLGEMADAEAAFNRLLKIGLETSDKRAASIGRLRLGWIYRIRGNLASAEDCAAEALRLAEADGWTDGMARAYGNLGVIYRTQSDLARAEDMHLKALKLNEELASEQGMAACYGNLGIIYQTQGDLARAEEMQLKSLKLEEQLGRKEGMAASYVNLGIIYVAQSDLVRAEDMQLKSLKLNQELGRKEGMAAAYGNLGVIHLMQDDLSRAEDMQLKSLELGQKLGRKEGMANACANLGIIYDRQNDLFRACAHWRRERDLYREMGLDDKAAAVERWISDRRCDTT